MKDLDLIYVTARELPPEERPAYLAKACEGDNGLRKRLEQMLAVADEAEAFITDLPDAQSQAPEYGPRTIKDLKPRTVDLPDEVIGQKIGRYKILERIGEGGCGVVYVAEQTEPVRRRVALKVIKLGMDTKQVVARFEAERQALAMMDHPNIAKVLDAGTTEGLHSVPGHPLPSDGRGAGGEEILRAGRPYFVMELVRGIKITDYCDQAGLPTKARLELFIQVCQAIQHAHQKGIIHRDIKPSNILVTLNDGVPKVIDFGIAKATEGRLTDATVYTQLHQFIGTPAYMSPEQAEMSSLDIDTRSDIYSLGVLLYELLAGTTPFDGKELMSLGLDAMRKTIREKEPVRPSTRLATLQGEELTTAAKGRAVEAPRLIHLLTGDLDWIVMKCLEKDRTRRYDTANGLAMDLQRHLGNEPVVARPPTTIYQMQKFVRRNKLAFAAGTVIAVMLILGIAGSLWQAARADREAGRALKAEAVAKERLVEVGKERDGKELASQDAEAVSKFLTEVFRSPDPGRNTRTITVAEALDKAAKTLQSDPAVPPARRAKLQATLGETYATLGLYREAIPLQEQARDYNHATFGPENTNTFFAMFDLPNSYDGVGRRDEALKLREEVLRLGRKLFGPEHRLTISAMASLASSYAEAGRRDEALKLREEVLRLARKVFGPEHSVTLGTMNNLAASDLEAGRRGEALKLQEEVAQLDRKVLGLVHPITLTATLNLAILYNDAGRRDEAIKLQEDVLPLFRQVLGPEHPTTLTAMLKLADSYGNAHRRDEALNLRKEVVRLSRKINGPEHPETLNAMNNLAHSYVAAGHGDEAFKLWKSAEDELAPSLNRNPFAQESANTYFLLGKYLATVYLWQGRTNEHQGICRRLLELAANSEDPTVHERAAKAYLLQPRPDPELLKLAVSSGRQALALSPTNHAFRSWFLITAGLADVRDTKPAQAEPLLTQALHKSDNPDQGGLALAYRAIALVQLGRANEARTDFAAVEKLALPLPRHDSFSSDSMSDDHLAMCIAYEEAKALLNAPRALSP